MVPLMPSASGSWHAILLVHAAATLFMTGLIWFVQVVHYPLFAHVGREALSDYARRHARLTTFIVAPAMSIELLSAVAVVALRPGDVPWWLGGIGGGLLAAIWLSTAFLQVPLHGSLQRNDAAAIRKLVASNWLRTSAWSARAIVALALLW